MTAFGLSSLTNFSQFGSIGGGGSSIGGAFSSITSIFGGGSMGTSPMDELGFLKGGFNTESLLNMGMGMGINALMMSNPFTAMLSVVDKLFGGKLTEGIGKCVSKIGKGIGKVAKGIGKALKKL